MLKSLDHKIDGRPFPMLIVDNKDKCLRRRNTRMSPIIVFESMVLNKYT
jgi:hypothetical protein